MQHRDRTVNPQRYAYQCPAVKWITTLDQRWIMRWLRFLCNTGLRGLFSDVCAHLRRRLVSLRPKPYLEFTVVPQRTGGRIPGSRAAHLYELAKTRLVRFLSRFGGTNGFFDGDSRRGSGALGAMGERLATRRLRRQGYRIMARNYRVAGAEIDVIAMDGDTLVFVEVKTRTGSAAGRPEEAVHGLKQHRIRRAAAIFAHTKAMDDSRMRFDVVAVSRPAGRWHVEIIKDAF